jgi:hypothetical protein
MDETEPEEFVFGCPTCHPSAVNAEPIPEDVELPFKKPAAPLERTSPGEPNPVPPSDRSARLGSEPEAGGFGTSVAPYDESVEPPAIPESPASLIPESRNSIPVIPAGDGAAQFESRDSFETLDSRLQPVEFVDDAGSLPGASLIEQAMPVRSADPFPTTLPSATEDDFAPPVPLDGGLSDEGFFPRDSAGHPPAARNKRTVAFPFSPNGLAPVQGASRRQLLQNSPQSIDNGSGFIPPRNITDESDGFRPPLEQGGIVPASGVRQADSEATPPAHDSARFPRWGRFFKRGE